MAALMVMWSHWGINFYTNNEVCGLLGLFSKMTIKPPFWINIPLGYLNFGPLGVSIFFLITGYLVSASLKRGSKKFLENRIIRVYPVYIVGLLITLAILFCSSRVNGVTFPYNAKTILQNMSLFRMLFWAPTIDGVVWTLECQMFFWILVSFMKWILDDRWNSNKTVVIYTLLSSVVIFIISQIIGSLKNDYFSLYVFFTYIETNLNYAGFMMIGISLYCYKNKEWTREQLVRTLIFQTFMTAFNFNNISFGNRYMYWFNYGLGVIIFITFMLLDDKFSEKNVINTLLKKFSKISFSFYIIHGAAGYAVMAWLYRYISSPYIILILTFATFVIISAIVYYCVEAPINKLAKRISL